MDKLMDNRWFMKIVALLLALLLYSSVPQSNGKNTEVDVPSEKNTETITDVPVNAYYDTDNLVVSGLPDTVEMTVNGPNPHVQSAKALRNFEIYIDLSNAKIGTQTVKLRIKGLSDKLNATLEPAFANISIQEKITKEFDVDAEYNQSMIREGYIADRPIVEPNKIKVTGAKDIIDRIAYVKATVDVKNPIQDTITREARIRVLDRELNKLEVIVEPETVDVTIPIKSSNKTVPIKVVQKGTPPPGVEIDSILLDEKEAIIIAPDDILKKTESVRVEVDVSKVEEDTSVTLPVIISNGVIKVAPETVKATIKVKKTESKTLSGLSINTEGLQDEYDVQFKNPADGKVNLDVFGNTDAMSRLKSNDFNLFVDLSGLKEGEHEVEIQVKGPSAVNWQLEKETAQMIITKSEA